MDGLQEVDYQGVQDLQLEEVTDEQASQLELQHEVDRIPEGVAEITLCALLENPSPGTMKVCGRIKRWLS